MEERQVCECVGGCGWVRVGVGVCVWGGGGWYVCVCACVVVCECVCMCVRIHYTCTYTNISPQQEAHMVRVAASSSNCYCASLYPFLSSTIQIFRSGCFSVGSNIKRKREFSDTNFEIGKPQYH